LKVNGNKPDEFFIGLAVDWPGFELREPDTTFRLLQRANTSVGLDLYLNYERLACHCEALNIT
jgi:hypothetical protein